MFSTFLPVLTQVPDPTFINLETRKSWRLVLPYFCLFIITDKTRTKGPGRKSEGVGVMKDKELNLEETETSHTRWIRRRSCPGEREGDRVYMFLIYRIHLDTSISPVYPKGWSHRFIQRDDCVVRTDVPWITLLLWTPSKVIPKGKTGTPKDRDEVSSREFWVSDGWVCDLEVIGVPSIFKTIRSPENLTRMWPTLDLCGSIVGSDHIET